MEYKYKNISEQQKQGGYDFNILKEYHYINIGATTVDQLQKAGILPKKNYTGLTSNKPDGLILYGKDDVRVLIEYKKDGIFASKEEALSIITDWYFILAEKLNCNVICASDGTNTYWFFSKTKELIKDEKGNDLRIVFDSAKIANNKLTDEEKYQLVQLFDQFKNLSEDGHLKKKSILNPEKLAKKVWQTLWINTGKEPERCLYNVVEIFIFKFLSDLGILTNTLSFNHIYELSKENADLALITYANTVRDRIKIMFPPNAIDNTTVINGTIFIHEGKANLKNANLFNTVLDEFYQYDKKYGSFTKIDKQFKTRLYESFLRESAGISAMGQYFTPRNVVIAIMRMINKEFLKEDIKVCDPFCGVGGFVLELLNEYEHLIKQFEPINGKINPKMILFGFDKGSDEKEDERTIILAKANMLIYFSDILAKYNRENDTEIMTEFSNQVFNKVFRLEKTNLGTLRLEKDRENNNSYTNYFDLIITNPPYVTSGVSSIKKEIKDQGLESMYPSNGNGLEGLALEWIINALKPNGKSFIILPDGIMSRQGDKRLRDKILDTCTIDGIISLPSRTFFATPKKTYIVALTKKAQDDRSVQTKLFFTYLISEIGETRDAKRFEISDNDLIKMSSEFKSFMVNRDIYESKDLRCKIHNISRLQNQHWLIDRDWTEDEKKELGLQEDNTEFTEDEFDKILGDLGNLMISFSKGIDNGI